MADAPENINTTYGNYYAWGEITTKESYAWNNYKWGAGTIYESDLTKYCNQSGYGKDGFTDDHYLTKMPSNVTFSAVSVPQEKLAATSLLGSGGRARQLL